MTSYPANFIPIEEAFEEAVAKLEPGARTDAADDALSSVDEDEADKIYQTNGNRRRIVERLFRDALADGPLVAWIKSESGGQMEILSDREAWLPAAFGVPGFEPKIHRITNPGPNDDREVFIEQANLKAWLETVTKSDPSAPELTTPSDGPRGKNVAALVGRYLKHALEVIAAPRVERLIDYAKNEEKTSGVHYTESELKTEMYRQHGSTPLDVREIPQNSFF